MVWLGFWAGFLVGNGIAIGLDFAFLPSVAVGTGASLLGMVLGELCE